MSPLLRAGKGLVAAIVLSAIDAAFEGVYEALLAGCLDGGASLRLTVYALWGTAGARIGKALGLSRASVSVPGLLVRLRVRLSS